MTKVIIREIIIALLVCLAIMLLLSVGLYNFIPSNKVIPEVEEYSPSQDIQAQLNAVVEDDSNDIIKTYEITAQDLENYQKTNDYKQGKSNPFAAYTAPVTTEDASTGTDSENGTSGNTSNTTETGSSTSNSGGSLFENGSSK